MRHWTADQWFGAACFVGAVILLVLGALTEAGIIFQED